MGRLASIPLRTDPGLSLSCALDICGACSRPDCTCRCHHIVKETRS